MSTIRRQKLSHAIQRKVAQSSIDYTNLPTSNAYLLHHHCRLVCAQIQNLHPSTLPLESAMQHRMRTHQRNCYLFQNLKLQPYTVDTKAMEADTQSYLSGTSGVSQSVSHPSCVVILTVVLEVDKVWPNFVICTLPIVPLCT